MPPLEIDTDTAAFGKVKWAGVAGSVDSDDDDDLPDTHAVQGNIIFTPSTPGIAYPNAVPKYTRLLYKRTVAVLDGKISEQGRDYVKLEASVPGMAPDSVSWKVTFSLGVGGIVLQLPALTISLEPGEELDLSDILFA